jgi:hypothetical protein
MIGSSGSIGDNVPSQNLVGTIDVDVSERDIISKTEFLFYRLMTEEQVV